MRYLLLLTLFLPLGVAAQPTQAPVTVKASRKPQMYGFLATQGKKLVELRVIDMTKNEITVKVEDFHGKVLYNGGASIQQKLPVAGAGVRVFATGSGGSLTLQPKFGP